MQLSLPRLLTLPDRVQKAQHAVNANCWDTDAWNVLVQYAQNVGLPDCRHVFDCMLQVFPTAGRFWKIYIETELGARNFDVVEQLFHKCLLQCLDVELWMTYLRYVKLAWEGQETFNQELKRAYDFTLENIGLDANSSEIWVEYIQFLRAQKVTNAFEQSQQITVVRRAYHSAIALPLGQIDQIWKEYCSWELMLNKELAKEMLAQKQSVYINAKSSRKDRQKFSGKILLHILARPPPEGLSSQMREYKQVLYWKKFIDFEKTNPQRLEPEKLKDRIEFTYKQALMTLRHYPEIWYDYYMHYMSSKSLKDAERILGEATKTLPDNLLLHFIYADYHELQKNLTEARQIYEDLIAKSASPLAYIQYMRFVRRSEGIDAARKVFVSALNDEKVNSFEIYVAGAMMEHQWNKQSQVATKIFNHGMKKFSSNVKYLMGYLEFLNSINDYNNMRLIIEQALKDLPLQESKPIWDIFLRMQNTIGDLNSIQEVENRRAAAYEGSNETESSENIFYADLSKAIRRYQYEDLLPCSVSYLKSLQFSKDLHKLEFEGDADVLSALKSDRKSFSDPDTSKMVRFNPGAPGSASSGPWISSTPNTLLTSTKFIAPRFPLHPIILELLQRLPHHSEYRSSPHEVDRIISLIREVPSPEELKSRLASMEAEDERDDEISGQKRASTYSAANAHRPPPQDIYRKRQAKKQKV